jgi:predicted DNA-binding transcriptional regulator AlpA
MILLSTREAAKKLGITHATLSRYLAAKKIPPPKTVTSGRMTVHLWSLAEIEAIRKLLPKIANGRKTRWQRQREALKKEQPRSKRK